MNKLHLTCYESCYDWNRLIGSIMIKLFGTTYELTWVINLNIYLYYCLYSSSLLNIISLEIVITHCQWISSTWESCLSWLNVLFTSPIFPHFQPTGRPHPAKPTEPELPGGAKQLILKLSCYVSTSSTRWPVPMRTWELCCCHCPDHNNEHRCATAAGQWVCCCMCQLHWRNKQRNIRFMWTNAQLDCA